MRNPKPTLVWMALLVALVVAGGTVVLIPHLADLQVNAVAIGLVLVVLLIGVAANFGRVGAVSGIAGWVDQTNRGFTADEIPALLAPLARIVYGREREGFTMSVPAMRSIVDGIRVRLEDARRIARTIAGLVLIAGVLGALWAVFQAERNAAALTLILALAGTALLVVLGMQARLAEHRAIEDLEIFLASRAYLPSRLPGGEDALPSYLQALLEQTAENLAAIQQLMAKREEERAAAQTTLTQLTERLTELTDQLRAEQKVMMALSKNQLDLQPAVADLANQVAVAVASNDALREHVRNVDAALARLVEEVAGAREQVPSAMRQEIKLLARTLRAVPDA